MVVRKRLSLTGPAAVFVTTTIKDWVQIFSDETLALSFLEIMHESIVRNELSLLSYALMPSHLHALFGFKRIELLSGVIQEVKSVSSRRLKPLLPENLIDQMNKDGKFQSWKPRFDDLIIWSEKQFLIKMDYIHNNPVKDGLVNKSTDYPFSSARDWNSCDSGLLPIDKNWSWAK